MKRTCVSELPGEVGRRVRLEGWVHRRRDLSRVTFLVLRDRTGLAQVVATGPEQQAELSGLTEDSVVRVEGLAVANPKAPGGFEVVEPTVVPLGASAQTPPFALHRPTLEVGLPTFLDHAAIGWRHPAQRAIWDVAAASVHGFRATLDAAGFTEVLTPKIVGTSTESGANVFALDWFGSTAYLAQSPQFYKQHLVGVFERVYEVGPVFRAEPHDTVRHLAQYVSLDVELGFVQDHRDVLAVLRDVLAGMVEAVDHHRTPASRATPEERRVPGWVAGSPGAMPQVPAELPVVHFTEALRLVGAPEDEPDLAPEHERALGRWALAEFGSEFLAVEGFPAAKRPFYTHPSPADGEHGPGWTNSFDVLFRGVELVTGGQRLHEYDAYVAALRARGEDPAALDWYLEPFRHGMPPHGGFAIGLERWTARVTGQENVRRAALFPRDVHRLTP